MGGPSSPRLWILGSGFAFEDFNEALTFCTAEASFKHFPLQGRRNCAQLIPAQFILLPAECS